MSGTEAYANGSSRASSKPKKYTVSGGTVSAVIGKDYFRSTQSASGPRMSTKPLRVELRKLSMTELSERGASVDIKEDDGMHKDIEDFLFTMLGDGFQLGSDVIREVLGYHGYDMKQSVDKLLELSEASTDKRGHLLGEFTEEATDTYPKSGSISRKINSQDLKFDESLCSNEKGSRKSNGAYSLYHKNSQEEVLASFFRPSEEPDVSNRSLEVRAVRRSKAFGELVVEPPRDTTSEQKTDADLKQDNEDAGSDEEDGYQILRRAVKEYRATMKEYYKAAAVSFSEGNRARASKLLEEGQFYKRKAREADEESARKIYETRNRETGDEMPLDLHDHDAGEAIRLLRCHLSSLSGIPSIKFLKVIMETNEKDGSKKARLRWEKITKLLDTKSIKWTEGHAGTILIRLDQINPKQLGFTKDREKLNGQPLCGEHRAF